MQESTEACGVPKLRTDTESEAIYRWNRILASHGCAIERLVVDLSNPQLAPRLLELRLTLDRARRGGAGEAPSLFDLVGRARDL